MLKNVKCARCVKCGKEYEAVPNLTNCECGGILDIIYDYDYIKANLTKEKLKSRPNTMWRYRELLPVEETTPDTPLRVGFCLHRRAITGFFPHCRQKMPTFQPGQYAVQEFLQILFVDFAKFQPDSLTKFLFDKKSFPKQEAWKICPFAA